MGYTLSTPMWSLRQRDTLADFLRGPDGLRPFSRVLADAPEVEELDALQVSQTFWGKIKTRMNTEGMYDPTTHLMVGKDELAYGAGDLRLGFNFSTSGIYAPFMWNLCRWMALQGGRKKYLNALSTRGVDKAAHYVLYDHEPMPFLLTKDLPTDDSYYSQELRRMFQVDDLGFRPVGIMYLVPDGYEAPGEPYEGFRAFDKIVNQVVRTEIVRIDQAWKRCSTT